MATVNSELLLQGLKDAFNVEEFQAKFEAMKGFKFNPFKFGLDGTPEGWDIFVADGAVMAAVFLDVIKTAERLCYETGEVAKGGDKLDAVAKFFDEVIDLPFYLEWADGPAIKMIISFLVNSLNKLFGKDWLTHIPVPA